MQIQFTLELQAYGFTERLAKEHRLQDILVLEGCSCDPKLNSAMGIVHT